MSKAAAYLTKSRAFIGSALIAAGLVLALASAASSQTSERKTEAYFASIRSRPQKLGQFLRQMPKGADLHNHLSGAVYAESYVKWAAAASNPRMCVDSHSLALVQESAGNPCGDAARPAASQALNDSGLFNRLIDAWSMRNWQQSGESGHDHFFRAFGKFGAIIQGHLGDMMAEVVSRAGRGHISYVELMLTADGGLSASIGAGLQWRDDLPAMRTELLEKGISKAVQKGRDTLDEAEASARETLGCGGPKPDPGCAVAVKFILQVGRTSPPPIAFAQMVAAMETAGIDQRVAALNLVQPEDSPSALENFAAQMHMLDYLHSVYPKVRITLHAGELASGLVSAEALKSHIRDSIEQGHAARIGHGVDVIHEQDSIGLLKEMAQRKILVEICLSSNDLILGVRGKDHPLGAYIKYGVPVALATDDEGVSRSEMTKEYLKAVADQALTYAQLKRMARDSLEYSFASGSSLWRNSERLLPVPECASGLASGVADSRRFKRSLLSCVRYLADNEKARLQWKLEEQFREFERWATRASGAARK